MAAVPHDHFPASVAHKLLPACGEHDSTRCSKTFGIVHAVTQGGPSKATETLIYKVFNDGFIGLDFGGSSAQSVVLMLIVMVLTFLQFRYVERKVTY